MIGARHLILALCLVLAAPALQAQECGVVSVIATAVDFGAYDPTSRSATDGVGAVEVRCSGSDQGMTAFEISLEAGLGDQAGPRRLSGEQAELRYELFADAARTRIWGDGRGGSPLVDDGIGAESTRTHQVYGRIFAGQNVPPGEYRDRVTVRIFF